MNPRLLTAFEYAADACRNTAANIRAALPEDDGDPEARIRTPDGLTEDDAVEWDEDARLIKTVLDDRIGGPTTVVQEIESENRELRAQLEVWRVKADAWLVQTQEAVALVRALNRRIPNADDLRTLATLARIGSAETWKPTELPEHRHNYESDLALIARVRATLEES